MKIHINKRILFTVNKYLAYIIKFVQGLFIAGFLGPYYLGIWGFITLVLQYFTYSNLGIQYSINVELSILDKGSTKNYQRLGLINFNGVMFSILSSLFFSIIGIALYFIFPSIGSEYQFNKFIVLVFMIGGVNNINIAYINIYRSYDNLFKIGLAELLFSLIPCLFIFFFKNEQLIFALLISMLSVRIFNQIMFNFRFPYQMVAKVDYGLIKSLIISGFGLLLYNASYNFYFMMQRSIVSYFYTVSEMGQFTFAFILTNAIMLGLQTLLFTIYPKILFTFRKVIDSNKQEMYSSLKNYASLYNTAVRIIVFGVIIVNVFIFHIFKKYLYIQPLFVLLLLSQAIFSCSTIHGALAFAQKKQWFIIKYTLIYLVVFSIASLALAYFKLNLTFFGIITLLYSISFSSIQIKFVLGLLSQTNSYYMVLKDMFPLTFVFPFLIVCSGIFFNNWWIFAFGGLLYFLLNWKMFKSTSKDLISFIK